MLSQQFEHLALLNGTTVDAVRGQSAAKVMKYGIHNIESYLNVVSLRQLSYKA